jgi:hypothetical protein
MEQPNTSYIPQDAPEKSAQHSVKRECFRSKFLHCLNPVSKLIGRPNNRRVIKYMDKPEQYQ